MPAERWSYVIGLVSCRSSFGWSVGRLPGWRRGWAGPSLEGDPDSVALVVDVEEGAGPAIGQRSPDEVDVRAGQARDPVESHPAKRQGNPEVDDPPTALADLDPDRRGGPSLGARPARRLEPRLGRAVRAGRPVP